MPLSPVSAWHSPFGRSQWLWWDGVPEERRWRCGAPARHAFGSAGFRVDSCRPISLDPELVEIMLPSGGRQVRGS